MISMKPSDERLLLVSSCAFWILGCVIGLHSTQLGIGTSPDSASYLSVAQSLIGGGGFYDRGAPLLHFPPGYPVAISAVAALARVDASTAARLLNSLLLGSNILLAGRLAYIASSRNLSAALGTMLFLLVSEPFLLVHAMAWSEPLFMFLTMSGLLLLCLYCERPSVLRLICWSALFGLAFLTRNVGVTLLGLAVFVIPMLRVVSPHWRRHLAISTSILLAPIGIWTLRNLFIVHAPSDASLSFHHASLGHLRALATTVHHFLIAAPMLDWLRWVEFCLLCVGATVYMLEGWIFGRRPHPAIRVLFFFCVIYIGFLFLSISIYSVETPLDDRMLMPAMVVGLVALVSLLWTVTGDATPRMRQLVAGAFLLFVSLNLTSAMQGIQSRHAEGTGFASAEWRRSEVMSQLRRAARGRIVYANANDPIWLLDSIPARLLPKKMNSDNRRPIASYRRDAEAVCREVQRGAAVVVYFDRINYMWYVPNETEWSKSCQVSHRRLSDGTIYGILE